MIGFDDYQDAVIARLGKAMAVGEMKTSGLIGKRKLSRSEAEKARITAEIKQENIKQEGFYNEFIKRKKQLVEQGKNINEKYIDNFGRNMDENHRLYMEMHKEVSNFIKRGKLDEVELAKKPPMMQGAIRHLTHMESRLPGILNKIHQFDNDIMSIPANLMEDKDFFPWMQNTRIFDQLIDSGDIMSLSN